MWSKMICHQQSKFKRKWWKEKIYQLLNKGRFNNLHTGLVRSFISSCLLLLADKNIHQKASRLIYNKVAYIFTTQDALILCIRIALLYSIQKGLHVPVDRFTPKIDFLHSSNDLALYCRFDFQFFSFLFFTYFDTCNENMFNSRLGSRVNSKIRADVLVTFLI